MLTDAKLLDLVYGASTCYVPSDSLNEEQLERFENIRYRWCNCRRCKKALKIGDKTIIPQNAGHANQKTLEISLSRAVFKHHIDVPYSMFLFDLIKTALHEIVHIVFPEFSEEQTINKTFEWLKNNEWVTSSEQFDRLAKAQFEEEVIE